MNFSTIDVIIVVLYLLGIAIFGIRRAGRQRSSHDYFLSESAVPWWAVCAAIVATETSAITFISVPGIAYISNLQFLQVALGYIIGRIIVGSFFIPAYFRGELSTAYAFLEARFGSRMRKSASLVFMGTRMFADGVRLFTTAIPLALLLKGFGTLPLDGDTFYVFSIIAIACITMLYVFLGGVRAVIWTDVIQMFIYFIGAFIACGVLLDSLPVGFMDAMGTVYREGKFTMLSPGFDYSLGEFFTKPYTSLAGILGGMFLSMASHGTDHIIVQRVLATNDPIKGRRAMITSGFIVFIQFFIFLFIGVLLYVYYQGIPVSPNEVFPKFILEQIPTGLAGLIIAGLLAAAMSTLSGSISALSSSTMMDIVLPIIGRSRTSEEILRWSRLVSIAWCVVLVGVALLFIGTSQVVIEVALSIASFTYGGLLGVFLLGIFIPRTDESASLAGFFGGIAVMTAVILFTPVAWTWYTLVGSVSCIGIALMIRIFPSTGKAEA